MGSVAGKGNRKKGRNQRSCDAYKARGQLFRNKVRKYRAHVKRATKQLENKLERLMRDEVANKAEIERVQMNIKSMQQSAADADIKFRNAA